MVENGDKRRTLPACSHVSYAKIADSRDAALFCDHGRLADLQSGLDRSVLPYFMPDSLPVRSDQVHFRRSKAGRVNCAYCNFGEALSKEKARTAQSPRIALAGDQPFDQLAFRRRPRSALKGKLL